MPIGHDVFFRNLNGLSHYSPQLVRKGVLLLSHFGPVWGATRAACAMQKLLVEEPLFSLHMTEGLALWAVARASWVLRGGAKF